MTIKSKTSNLISCSRLLLLFVSLILPATYAMSEEVDKETEAADSQQSQGWIEDFLQTLGADGEFDPNKLIDFSYLPGPFYNPEMDLGVHNAIAFFANA